MDSGVSTYAFYKRSLSRTAKASCVRADNLNIHEVSCEWSGTSFKDSLAPYRGFFHSHCLCYWMEGCIHLAALDAFRYFKQSHGNGSTLQFCA